jgi:prepilin-type processing-associated H-X9-DG protein
MSVSPPGVNGTTTVMFADGHADCASAKHGMKDAAAAEGTKPRTSRRRTAFSPLKTLAAF